MGEWPELLLATSLLVTLQQLYMIYCPLGCVCLDCPGAEGAEGRTILISHNLGFKFGRQRNGSTGEQVLGEGLVQQGGEFWAKPRGNPFFQYWRDTIPVPSRPGGVRQILFSGIFTAKLRFLLGPRTAFPGKVSTPAGPVFSRGDR